MIDYERIKLIILEYNFILLIMEEKKKNLRYHYNIHFP